MPWRIFFAVISRESGNVTRTYRLDGLLASQSFPSSITETLAYDAAKRPVSISLGAAGSLSQAFDRAGNVTSDGRSLTNISGDAGSGTQTFGYDALSRLLSSSGVSSAAGTYEFDLDGNRVKRVEGGITTTSSYDRTDQVVSQTIAAVTSTFAHDRYGNLTTAYDKTSAATGYTRDAASRLVGITSPAGGAITFSLDALDRHTTRSVGGVLADTYAYLDATETAWQSGTGSTSALLDVDGSRLAVKTGGTVSWLVFDLHGSVAALANTSGSLTDAYRFNGWGEQVASAGSVTNPWRYRGLLNIGPDSTTGALLDMAARDYAPHLGTFTQQDSYAGSAANPASMNRFLYAHANPATLIDPDGHMVENLGTYVPPSTIRVPGGAESVSNTTYVSKPSTTTSTSTTWSPTSRADRDDWENDPPASYASDLLAPYHTVLRVSLDFSVEFAFGMGTALLNLEAKEAVEAAERAKAAYLRLADRMRVDLPRSLLGKAGTISWYYFSGSAKFGQLLNAKATEAAGHIRLFAGKATALGLRAAGAALTGTSIALTAFEGWNEQSRRDAGMNYSPEERLVRAGIRAGLTAGISTAAGLVAFGACLPSFIGSVACGALGAAGGQQIGTMIADDLLSLKKDVGTISRP
jgi:RHS repeat-associated protein